MLSAAADQERLICEEEIGAAVSPAGVDGEVVSSPPEPLPLLPPPPEEGTVATTILEPLEQPVFTVRPLQAATW